uniref:Uncharacterized protein n=1 Tax=Arundo donax TaxID=35708 RepID=A0A0A9CIP7_ARUDO
MVYVFQHSSSTSITRTETYCLIQLGLKEGPGPRALSQSMISP